MADAAILKNRKVLISIFTADWPILTKFFTLMCLNALDPVSHEFKNCRWRQPPSWKIKKLQYLHNGLTDFDEIWNCDASQHSEPVKSSKISLFGKSKMTLMAILKIQKIEKLQYLLHNGTSDFDEVWYDDAPGPFGHHQWIKLCHFKKSKMAAAAILKNWKS